MLYSIYFILNNVSGNVSVSGNNVVLGTVTSDAFIGDGSNISGVQATSIGTLSGTMPLVIEGNTTDDFQTTIAIEEPTEDRTITMPNTTGTVITTANDSDIDQVGTITSGVWNGTAIADEYIPNDITLSGATIDNSTIGNTVPATVTATTIITNTGLVPDESDGAFLGTTSSQFSDVYLADGAVINLGDDQDVNLTHIEDTGVKLNGSNQLQFGDSGTQISQSADGVLDLVSDNEVEINGTLIDVNGNVELENATVDYISIDGTYIGHADDADLMTLANGTLTVSGTLAATTFNGDGSNLTGISASSISADDIAQGDAAVTISTSSGSVNINPASGSPILLDNTINIDGSLIGHTDDTDLMTLATVSYTHLTLPTSDLV